MTDKNQAAKRQPGKALVLGTISGLFTELICYPFDFMKNVIQIEKKFSGRGMRYTANTQSMVGKGFIGVLIAS